MSDLNDVARTADRLALRAERLTAALLACCEMGEEIRAGAAPSGPEMDRRLVMAVLGPGPGTTREVAEAVHAADHLVLHSHTYRALRRLEADGDVTGLRVPGRGILWALRGVAVPAC